MASDADPRAHEQHHLVLREGLRGRAVRPVELHRGVRGHAAILFRAAAQRWQAAAAGGERAGGLGAAVLGAAALDELEQGVGPVAGACTKELASLRRARSCYTDNPYGAENGSAE